MNAEENTTSPQRPGRGLSASRMGYFGILFEIIGVLVAVFVGIRLLVPEGRPDVVAWVAFAIGAVLLIDLLRRIWRALLRARRDRRA